MRSATQLAALLAVLCGITAAKLWAADFAECAGIIVDENGVPIAAAKIVLQSGTGPSFRTETDGAGRFLLRHLPAGDYRVQARKEPFSIPPGPTLTHPPAPTTH